jgi:hypothetical protein
MKWSIFTRSAADIDLDMAVEWATSRAGRLR